MPWLGALLVQLLGTAAARVLTGAGLALVTFASLTPLVLSALNAAAQATNGIPSTILQLILLSGIGEALTAMGSAVLTRVVINSAQLAIKKS